MLSCDKAGGTKEGWAGDKDWTTQGPGAPSSLTMKVIEGWGQEVRVKNTKIWFLALFLPLTRWPWLDKSFDLPEPRLFHLWHGSALPALLSSSWRTVVGICGTEDPGALQKSPRISTTVVFYYLLGTNPPVWADTGARQWYVLQPWRSILGNNQYKMHWVWATIRVINVDSLLLDKINNAWEKHCKSLWEGMQSVSGERV